jgi:hypothetical protein
MRELCCVATCAVAMAVTIVYKICARALGLRRNGRGSRILKTFGIPTIVIEVYSVRCEDFTAVTMKNGVFWVTKCGSRKNRRFGGT